MKRKAYSLLSLVIIFYAPFHMSATNKTHNNEDIIELECICDTLTQNRNATTDTLKNISIDLNKSSKYSANTYKIALTSLLIGFLAIYHFYLNTKSINQNWLKKINHHKEIPISKAIQNKDLVKDLNVDLLEIHQLMMENVAMVLNKEDMINLIK